MSAAGVGIFSGTCGSLAERTKRAIGRFLRWLAAHQAVIVGLFVALVFVGCTWFTLGTRLGDDDIMNLTFAWVPKWRDLGVALIVPFTHFYRPMGSLLYRIVFDLFGLNFVPFRIAVYLLLLINLYLVYTLARRLSRSREIGALSALLFTFHGRMAGIYLNNGTLYDILCATLSLLTLLYYVSVRQRSETIRGWRWVVFLALFIMAINSKEMAAALPILLLIYEWLSCRPVRIMPAIAAGALAALAAYARMSPGSAFYGDSAYTMTLTAHQFMSHWTKLMSDLLYLHDPGMSAARVGMIWLAMIAVAATARKRHLWFFLAFALLAPLPVIFIPWRGLFVMYLPYAGWVMYAATILVEGRNWLWSRVWERPPLGANAFEPERLLLFGFATFLVIQAPRWYAVKELHFEDPSHRYVRALKNELVRLNQPLPEGAHVLLLHDNFPVDSWGPLQLAVLLYRDRALRVDRPSMMKTPPDPAVYDCVFDYTDNRLVVVRARPGAGRRMERPRS